MYNEGIEEMSIYTYMSTHMHTSLVPKPICLHRLRAHNCNTKHLPVEDLWFQQKQVEAFSHKCDGTLYDRRVHSHAYDW